MKSLLLLNVAYYVAFCKTFSNQQLIANALMANYDRINIPMLNTSQPIEIRLNPQLFSILEVNVARQTLTLKQWLNMYWYDPNLKWDPKLYGGVDTIMLQRSTIWLPDVVIVQQTTLSTIADELSVAQIRSDGYVGIGMDELVTIACEYDVSDFPYDTQNCSVRYSSWMYIANQLDPSPTDPTDMSVYCENDEWTLRSYTSRKQTSNSENETYVDVYYDIKMTRKPSYYVSTFMWPSFLITCLSIIGVFSPFNDSGEREEKVTMGLTTLLTMAVILMIITGDMPKSSNGIPLLGIFIMLQIGIASVATVLSVFIIYLHKSWISEIPVPIWLLYLTCMVKRKRKHSTVADVSHKNGAERDSKTDPKTLVTVKKCVETLNLNINVSEMHHNSLREQWSMVTHRLDLFLMIIFLVANVVICATVMAVGNSKLNN